MCRRWIVLVLALSGLSAALLSCANLVNRGRAGHATGPVGEWVELPWQGVEATLDFNVPRLHAAGDTAYLLVNDRFYRSLDHGAHWEERSQILLEDFEPFGERIFGWSGNWAAPLWVSKDGGESWEGRPTEAVRGDSIVSTGAPRSPKLFRTLGGLALMVPPEVDAPLLVSSDPPDGWTRGSFRSLSEFEALARREGFALDTEVLDVGAFRGDLYACTRHGFFRSRDGGRSWDQIPSPDGTIREVGRCRILPFESPLCVLLFRNWEGRRLYCSSDGSRWQRIGRGLYPDEPPPVAEWAGMVGPGRLRGAVRAGERWFLAHDGDHTHVPCPAGFFVTPDPFGEWARVDLRGQAVLAIAKTSEAALLLAEAPPHERDSDPRLWLWRYRYRVVDPPAGGETSP